jgi:hypothetical protein
MPFKKFMLILKSPYAKHRGTSWVYSILRVVYPLRIVDIVM